ncbi:hypothetical protein A1O3_06721 [Capronia epimyces CBS 606.96]|uniref:Uncharacterized protein n=1 Tax=Capronia epimyces CBS 606.96 TaxID=1182542 RepID=W9XZX7_9EURO|nr:uncharacterized protein A1O3_06721 [Capronia epimyces CBS 606.96]EXJ82905.1 hypothetical protein A1O3_06721 [Capronia epimyces CBS 606.96]
MLRKWRLPRAARLTRLRATLRLRSLLATLVKTIHVPDPNIPLYLENGDPNPVYDAYLCTLACVVMICPNLEALTGFVPFYNHTFDRLTYALSTRPRLRQHIWVIAENDDIRSRCQEQLAPGLLDEYQRYQFVQYHERWKLLETLMLCSPGGLGVIEHDLFVDVLHSLPSLRHLCVSSFDADDFHDGTLAALPPIASLRLEECYGVTDVGLTKWASSPNATHIEKLSLVHQNIVSLLTLSKIFTSLDGLIKFSIVQNDVQPSLPVEKGLVVIQPVLASESLRFLHWDIFCDEVESSMGPNIYQTLHQPFGNHPLHSPWNQSIRTPHHMPNTQLALSIAYRGFPSLRQLRAPRDISPWGVLHSVCQPTVSGYSLLLDDHLHLRQFQENPSSSSLRVARVRAHVIVEQMVKERSAQTSAASDPSMAHFINDDPLFPQQLTGEGSTSSVDPQANDVSILSDKSAQPTETRPGHRLYQLPPVASDHRANCPSTGDPDKEVVADSKRMTCIPASDSSERESICQCELGSATSRGSICDCTSDTISNPDLSSLGSLPPQNPRRPGPLPVHQLNPPSAADLRPEERHRKPPSVRPPTTVIPADGPDPPVLYLVPDVPGHDGNGGLIGWGDLLKISEKVKGVASRKLGHAAHRGGMCNMQEDSEDESITESEQKEQGMCTGRWNRGSRSSDGSGEVFFIKKILTSPSMTSMRSAPENKAKAKSKSKSTSRLSLPLGLKSPSKIEDIDRWSHVARPRGNRGGCIGVEDFF